MDFLHVTEKLWELAHVLDEPAQQRMKMDGYVFMLLNGQARELTAWFRHEAKTRRLTPADRQKVESVCGYFENNLGRMRYGEYLAAGYPIASGVIEGACRHVVKDRLERTGMRWTVEGAQAMLQLRCIAINQQWDSFATFRVRLESDLIEFSYEEDLMDILKPCYIQIFENELLSWNNRKHEWPKERSIAIFLDWFKVIFCDDIFDLSSHTKEIWYSWPKLPKISMTAFFMLP